MVVPSRRRKALGNHTSTGRGLGGGGDAAAPSKFGQVSFWGNKTNFGQIVFKTLQFVWRNYNVISIQ